VRAGRGEKILKIEVRGKRGVGLLQKHAERSPSVSAIALPASSATAHGDYGEIPQQRAFATGPTDYN
jgi:hypothetical protein